MEQTLVNGIADNLLHNIFNDLSVGLELYDKDGLMIDVNYSRLRSMGIKDKKDILGHNLFNYTSFSDEIKEQIRKGETVRFVAKYDFDALRRLFPTYLSGTKYFEITVSFVHNEKSEVTNYMVITQDVTERVLRHHDVELARVVDQLHGGVVHQHVHDLDLRVILRHAVHDLAPHATGFQDVRLVDVVDLLAALHGRLEADAANALDFMLRVGHGIHSLLLAVFQRVSLVLAEVDAADELTHDDEVDALGHDLGLEGAGRGQLGPDLGRAVVGVEAHAGAETEQSLFGALLTGQTLPLGAADCAQKDAVGREALVQLMLGQRVAVLVNGLAAHCGVGIVEAVAVLFGHLIENAEGLLHDLGAGAVAPDDSNVFFHFRLLISSSATSSDRRRR